MSQSVFNLSSITYLPNNKQLLVFRDGLFLDTGVGYSETTGNQITLSSPANTGVKIKVLKIDNLRTNQERLNPGVTDTVNTGFDLAQESLLVFKNGTLLPKTFYSIVSNRTYILSSTLNNLDIVSNVSLEGNLREELLVTNPQDLFFFQNINFYAKGILVFVNGKLTSDFQILNNKTIKLNSTFDPNNISVTIPFITVIQPNVDLINLPGNKPTLAIVNELEDLYIGKETQIINLDNQKNISLKSIDYTPNTNNLLIFKDGILQEKSTYVESSNKNIVFNQNQSLLQKLQFLTLSVKKLIPRDEFLINNLSQIFLNLNLPINITGADCLFFKNGLLQTLGVDYIITSPTQIQFINPLTNGDKITAFYLQDKLTFSRVDSIYSSSIISVPTYLQNGIQLLIFANGKLLNSGVDYIESSPTQIEFDPTNIPQGSNISVIRLQVSNLTQLIGPIRNITAGGCISDNISTPIEQSIDVTFIADNFIIPLGNPVIIEWDAKNTSSVAIENFGFMEPSGKLTDFPLSTTTYKITAQNVYETVTKSITVTVVDDPSGFFTGALAPLSVNDPNIDILSPSVVSIAPGDNVLIQYNITNSISAYIQNGNTNEITPINLGLDQFEVSPLDTTIYTLSATDGTKTTTKTVVVQVDPLPGISFTADSTTITEGQSVNLQWNLVNTDTFELLENGNNILNNNNYIGSQLVNPLSNTTYELKAYNQYGQNTSTVLINVLEVPEPITPVIPTINFFNSNKNLVEVGDTVKLSWNTSNASTVILDNIGNVGLNGQVDFKIKNENSLIKLKIISPTGNIDEQTLEIKALKRPEINYLKVNIAGNAVESNTPFYIEWSTSHSKNTSITNVGNVPPTGRKKISLTQNQTFTIICSNGISQKTQTLQIFVKPKINIFLSDKTTIKKGETVSFAWQTVGSNTVSLTDKGIVSSSGSTSIKPDVTKEYILTSTNNYGQTIRKILITVVNES